MFTFIHCIVLFSSVRPLALHQLHQQARPSLDQVRCKPRPDADGGAIGGYSLQARGRQADGRGGSQILVPETQRRRRPSSYDHARCNLEWGCDRHDRELCQQESAAGESEASLQEGAIWPAHHAACQPMHHRRGAAQLDTDGNGGLSLEELNTGFEREFDGKIAPHAKEVCRLPPGPSA